MFSVQMLELLKATCTNDFLRYCSNDLPVGVLGLLNDGLFLHVGREYCAVRSDRITACDLSSQDLVDSYCLL